jgi:hypothetical protein
MAFLIYLIGIGLAIYAGKNELELFYILISGLIMVGGWVVFRLHACYSIYARGGLSGLLQLLFTNTIIYSIVTSIFYFIGTLFS